jgi:sulfur-oxidizing protein SoxX
MKHHRLSPAPTAGLMGALFLILFQPLGEAGEAASSTAKGKQVALEYCQACHYFTGSDQAGTVGPGLVAMRARFPERAKLYSVIYDPEAAINPYTMMPPFGRNELLSKEQIDILIDFLYTL